MKNKLYKQIASTLNAFHNQKTGNTEWEEKHKERLEASMIVYLIVVNLILVVRLTLTIVKINQVIIFYTSYHFMDENGFYDGWKN